MPFCEELASNYGFGELNTDGSVNAAKNTGNISNQTISFNGLPLSIFA